MHDVLLVTSDILCHLISLHHYYCITSLLLHYIIVTALHHCYCIAVDISPKGAVLVCLGGVAQFTCSINEYDKYAHFVINGDDVIKYAMLGVQSSITAVLATLWFQGCSSSIIATCRVSASMAQVDYLP